MREPTRCVQERREERVRVWVLCVVLCGVVCVCVCVLLYFVVLLCYVGRGKEVGTCARVQSRD